MSNTPGTSPLHQPSSTKPVFSVWHLALLCLAVWALFNLAETVHYVLTDYSPIPVEDFWRIPQLWANHQAIRWSNLWEQHNEHRIIFPELIDIADMLWLHGRMYLPIAVSGLCYFGIWLTLAWALYSRKVMAWPTREAALLLAGVVIFWKGCSSVIATPFQLSFTMLQLFSILALLFLVRLMETGRLLYLSASIAAGVICTYSVGNGMLIWVVLVLAAFFLRVSIGRILTLCLAAMVFTGAYFFHYRFLPSSMRVNIQHPLEAAGFLCSYFSMPFGGNVPLAIGLTMGAANLLLMAICSFVIWRRGLIRSRLGIAVFGAYLFTLLSALLTTAGRMDLNEYQFAQARAWRYVTMPTVSWALLAIALVWALDRTRSRNWSLAMVLVISVWFAFGFSNTADWVEGTRLQLSNAQVTATMLRNGVFDPNQVRTMFPNPDFVHGLLPVLRQFHKSIYARGDDKWIGADLLALPLGNEPVAGKITRVYPVPGGLEILGWAEVNVLTRDHEIIFADGQNRIVGFGRRPAAGMPANLSAWDTPGEFAFVGYVSLAKPVGKITVHVGTVDGGLFQPFDAPIAVPKFTQLSGQTDAAALPGIAWLPEPDWTIGGYPVDPENGPAPPAEVYGSWSGSGEKTGSVHTEPFATPPESCIVLPVLHGRATYGQSVQVRDADTGQVIADLPFLDGRSIWERWRIPIPAATQKLTIAADDRGTGGEQWLAVATPEHCTGETSQ